MKKLFYLLLCSFLVLGITGCGEETKDKEVAENSKNKIQDSEKVVSKSPREQEKETWGTTSFSEIENYESEAFFTDDVEIFYEMIDGYETIEKAIFVHDSEEDFKNVNMVPSLISVRLLELNYYGFKEGDYAGGAESRVYSNINFELKYDERNEVSSVKQAKIGDYDVYYYYIKSNVVYETSVLYIVFDINEDYMIEIVVDYFDKVKFENIKNTGINNFEELIRSFKLVYVED